MQVSVSNSILEVSNLDFQFFGSFAVWRGELRLHLTALPAQPLSILTHFLTQRHYFLAVALLIEHLWPHLAAAAATHQVQVTVGKMRRWLEAELVHGTDSRYVHCAPGGCRFVLDFSMIDVPLFYSIADGGIWRLLAFE